MFGQCSSLFYWTIHCIFWWGFFPHWCVWRLAVQTTATVEGTRANQALYQKNKTELTHLLSKVLTELLVPFRNEPVGNAISEGVRSTTHTMHVVSRFVQRHRCSTKKVRHRRLDSPPITIFNVLKLQKALIRQPRPLRWAHQRKSESGNLSFPTMWCALIASYLPCGSKGSAWVSLVSSASLFQKSLRF